jgi:uncharacterized Zn-binding protein involved in type VI secretion
VAITVYNEGAGLFHKGSGGKGVGPGDVCLTPPPPPTGPVPVPYVNMLVASDLADGSETVTVDGNPTALEDHSYVSTSTGDEAGTQGGSVITHKTKGKGYFTFWSFTLQIEGKGADRHGDPMGQNCASGPPSCVDMKALVAFIQKFGLENSPPCTEPYDRKKLGLEDPTPEQGDAVYGKACWECKRDLKKKTRLSFKIQKGTVTVTKTSAMTSHYADPKQMTPDHQPPISTAWEKGGCHMKEEDFKKWANDPESVKPHCQRHSRSQSGTVQGTEAKQGISDALSLLGI